MPNLSLGLNLDNSYPTAGGVALSPSIDFGVPLVIADNPKISIGGYFWDKVNNFSGEFFSYEDGPYSYSIGANQNCYVGFYGGSGPTSSYLANPLNTGSTWKMIQADPYGNYASHSNPSTSTTIIPTTGWDPNLPIDRIITLNLSATTRGYSTTYPAGNYILARNSNNIIWQAEPPVSVGIQLPWSTFGNDTQMKRPILMKSPTAPGAYGGFEEGNSKWCICASYVDDGQQYLDIFYYHPTHPLTSIPKTGWVLASSYGVPSTGGVATIS
jgi:hypothetical protein